MNTPSPTVFIVDDDPAILDALSLMIELEGLHVETFESAESFLANWQQDRYGCIVVDVRMPGMDGMQLQQEMNNRRILLPIIFLTGHGDIPMSVKAIKSGAVEFLTKPVSRDKFLECVHSAIQLGDTILDQDAKRHQAQTVLALLTKQEKVVMELAIKGLPNKVIARNLGLSFRTVEIHKTHIMKKTGAESLLDLSRLAQEAGLDR